jgi:hypothetical protein
VPDDVQQGTKASPPAIQQTQQSRRHPCRDSILSKQKFRAVHCREHSSFAVRRKYLIQQIYDPTAGPWLSRATFARMASSTQREKKYP